MSVVDSMSEGDTENKDQSNGGDFICGVVEGFYGRPWTADQRRDLFSRMRKLGMNTYLYAPKDELKHRAEWRLLYTSEETELLQSLISSAKHHGITFVYALSPGIDIVYSNEKEVKAVEEKLDQVRSMGCDAFALLFDDIEISMSDQDKKKFPSFVMAQLTVANTVYEYLKCPQFYFCPTEYCESRASPSLEESDYLSTLGKKLLKNIHILWTGPRVVSRYITVDHVRRVAAALKRKPVIWDNLHANDYDPKRVFLGPFAGRSVMIKEEISGIFLNPNCRYEANFVPFHTIAEWNSCHADAELEEGTESDAILEAGGVAPVAAHIVKNASPKRLYHPLRALDESVKKWLEHFSDSISSTVPPISQMESQTVAAVVGSSATDSSLSPVTIRTCEGNELLATTNVPAPLYTSSSLGSATTLTVQTFPLRDAAIGVTEAHTTVPQVANSLTTEYSEPMELVATTKEEPKPLEMIDSTNKMSTSDMAEISSDISMESSILSDSESSCIDLEQVSTFVDMFYLPFEHGRRGIKMLEEFSWLHENSYVVRKKRIPEKEVLEEAIIGDEWKRRSEQFTKCLRNITKLYRLIAEVPNKSIVQELFQYVYEAQGVTSVLEALVLWMADGDLNISPTECENWWSNGVADVEPWALGGGLLSDLQKLLFTSPYVADLLLLRPVLPFSLSCYTIRPYRDDDEKEIRTFFVSELDKFSTGRGVLHSTKEERFFDKTIGPYISCAVPRTSFVAVEHISSCITRIVAVICAALDAKQFFEKVHKQYLPKMRSKYNLYAEAEREEGDKSNEIEQAWQRQREEIADWEPPNLSSFFYEQFPSQLEIRCRSISQDAIAVKRLLHATAVALSFNGSNGFFTVLQASDKEKADLLAKLGLLTLNEAGFPADRMLMGHSL